jgi:hypothetical protein
MGLRKQPGESQLAPYRSKRKKPPEEANPRRLSYSGQMRSPLQLDGPNKLLARGACRCSAGIQLAQINAPLVRFYR